MENTDTNKLKQVGIPTKKGSTKAERKEVVQALESIVQKLGVDATSALVKDPVFRELVLSNVMFQTINSVFPKDSAMIKD